MFPQICCCSVKDPKVKQPLETLCVTYLKSSEKLFRKEALLFSLLNSALPKRYLNREFFFYVTHHEKLFQARRRYKASFLVLIQICVSGDTPCLLSPHASAEMFCAWNTHVLLWYVVKSYLYVSSAVMSSVNPYVNPSLPCIYAQTHTQTPTYV